MADVKRELSLEEIITTHETVMNTITRWCATGSVHDRTRSGPPRKVPEAHYQCIDSAMAENDELTASRDSSGRKAQKEAQTDKKRKGKGESKSRKCMKTLRRWRKLMRTSIRSVVPIMMKMSFQDAWIGCDNNDCVRWFHCWCAGFDRKPSSCKKQICLYCYISEHHCS